MAKSKEKPAPKGGIYTGRPSSKGTAGAQAKSKEPTLQTYPTSNISKRTGSGSMTAKIQDLPMGIRQHYGASRSTVSNSGDSSPSSPAEQVIAQYFRNSDAPNPTSETHSTQAILASTTYDSMLAAGTKESEMEEDRDPSDVSKDPMVSGQRKRYFGKFGGVPHLLDFLKNSRANSADFLTQPLVSNRSRSHLQKARLPSSILEFLSRFKMYHGFAVGIIAIAGIIGCALLISGEKSVKPQSVLEPISPPEEIGRNHKMLTAKAVAAGDIPLGKQPRQGQDTTHSQKTEGEYPPFLWKNHIEYLLKKTHKKHVSLLFGLTPHAVADALGYLNTWGPTGHDLLPNTQYLDAFVQTARGEGAPRLTFLFQNEKLIEIELRYDPQLSKVMEEDIFGPLLGTPIAKGKDEQGRQFSRYVDGNAIVEQFNKKDSFGRTFCSIVFSDKTTHRDLVEKRILRDHANAAFAKGMSLFNKNKFKAAKKRFSKATKLVPTFGDAYVMQAISLLRKEDFENADLLADKALINSSDNRARAKASGVKGVVYLYKGDKDQALKFFNAGVEYDDTNAELSASQQELETGNYSPERIAKTAARVNCLKLLKEKHKRRKHFTLQGILARGNFENETSYETARGLVEENPTFQAEFVKWYDWECR